MAFESENVFQFDFAKNFWFAQLDGKARAFVHRAESAEEANALLGALTEELSYDFGEARTGAMGTVMQHEFLKTWFALHATGRWVMGVENAISSEDAQNVVTSLSGALVDE